MARASVGGPQRGLWTTTLIPKEDPLPAVPERRALLIDYAIRSEDPLVKQALDRLLVTVELVHGEEVGATIRTKQAARDAEVQRRAKLNEIRVKLERERNARQLAEWSKRAAQPPSRHHHVGSTEPKPKRSFLSRLWPW